MSDLRRIQRIELDMLRALRRVCDTHHIDYYLAQGTLLGAARHRGFIPWDDDADVLVPAEQIDALVTAWQQSGDPEVLITNHHVEAHYPMTWTKLRRNGTTSMPRVYQSIPVHWGICIDIFPYFGLSDNALLRRLELFRFKLGRKLLLATMTACDGKGGALNRLIERLPLKLRRSLADACLAVTRRHAGQPTREVYVTCRGGHIIPRSLIEGETRTMDFEGEPYRVPARAEAYLTRMFGDYMTPPPEHERGGHELREGEIIWDCDVDYAAYVTGKA